MPPDNPIAAPASNPPHPPRRLFSVPAPIKRIFDRFPLITYPPNDIPQKHLSVEEGGNRLFIFTDAAGAKLGAPSFNPQCLKWQVRFLCTVGFYTAGLKLPIYI